MGRARAPSKSDFQITPSVLQNFEALAGLRHLTLHWYAYPACVRQSKDALVVKALRVLDRTQDPLATLRLRLQALLYQLKMQYSHAYVTATYSAALTTQ